MEFGTIVGLISTILAAPGAIKNIQSFKKNKLRVPITELINKNDSTPHILKVILIISLELKNWKEIHDAFTQFLQIINCIKPSNDMGVNFFGWR